MLIESFPFTVVDEFYSTIDARMKSFKDWPKYMKPGPYELSEAGLFYLIIAFNFDKLHLKAKFKTAIS